MKYFKIVDENNDFNLSQFSDHFTDSFDSAVRGVFAEGGQSGV